MRYSTIRYHVDMTIPLERQDEFNQRVCTILEEGVFWICLYFTIGTVCISPNRPVKIRTVFYTALAVRLADGCVSPSAMAPVAVLFPIKRCIPAVFRRSSMPFIFSTSFMPRHRG